MPITVGIIKELYFISKVLNLPVEVTFKSPVKHPLYVRVYNNILDVEYNSIPIWKETIEGDVSFFYIESCDSIARIIVCIDNGSPWQQYRWNENSLDKIASSS